MTRLFLLPALALALAACAPDPAPVDAVDPADDATAETVPAAATPATADPDAPLVTVYKTPTCGCCSLWSDYMAENGFRVENVDIDNLTAVKDSLGVPSDIGSCHTATVEGYVVEGHVPAEFVTRLLDEKPDALGLAVPGMPLGSPGMEQGDMRQPYDVLILDESGEAAVFASVPGSPGQG